MEESIEAAIDNPKNYNFGINRHGDLQVPEDTVWQELRERVQGHDKKASSSSATESWLRNWKEIFSGKLFIVDQSIQEQWLWNEWINTGTLPVQEDMAISTN